VAKYETESGSTVETEDDGDYTVTFSMTLPTPPISDDES
jgi:hypothetical protein